MDIQGVLPDAANNIAVFSEEVGGLAVAGPSAWARRLESGCYSPLARLVPVLPRTAYRRDCPVQLSRRLRSPTKRWLPYSQGPAS